jgi:hypothetical protein
VLRVLIDKDYNRAQARPLYNCPTCYADKERKKSATDRTEQ